MWKRGFFTQTRSRIALLVGQFIVLVGVIGYIEHVYTANILPDKQAKETYQMTDCFLIGKKLTTRGRLIHGYRAGFLISYNVNGVQYNRWVSGNGLDISLTQNAAEQENILSRFYVGGTYPCWYDPANPQLSILVMRHDWLSTFPLIVPSIVGVIAFYYFLKNLLQLIPAAGVSARESARGKEK